jgi:hypothetical protein
MLQERLRQQQQEAEVNAKVTAGSSARWKSAKPEKGSIRSYAKDVQEKQKKRAEAESSEQMLRSVMSIAGESDSSKKKLMTGNAPPPGNFMTKGIIRRY